MAKLETQHVFRGDVESVFRALTSYENYSKYLPGVTNVELISEESNGTKTVRFDLNLMKKFHYTLRLEEEKPEIIQWSLVDSNLMKSNDGLWRLKSKSPEKTQADYEVEIKFKGLVPSSITDRIAKANLGGMFQGFQDMIDAQN